MEEKEVLYLLPMIPPKRFDIFPLTGGCSEGLDAFRFFFKIMEPNITIITLLHETTIFATANHSGGGT